jgi:hypothetical protein
MDPFDLIANDIVEQFGLFEKWRSERQHKKAVKAMARGDTESASEHRSKSKDLYEKYESRQNSGSGPVPRRHMTRSEHEAMMDERDGRPRRPRRRRRRRSS